MGLEAQCIPIAVLKQHYNLSFAEAKGIKPTPLLYVNM